MSENIEDSLDKLRTFCNSSYPILSVYLPTEGNHLQASFKQLASTLPDSTKKLVEPDIVYIDSFLEGYQYKNKHLGLALFSGGNQVWEVVGTPYPLPKTIKVDHAPCLDPLFDARESYKRYVVILADRKKAIFLIIFNGVVEEKQVVRDESVPQDMKGKRTGGKADIISRHILDHMHRHLQLIVEKLKIFVGARIIAGIILGGHEEMLTPLRKIMPQQFDKKIIGQLRTTVSIQNINTIVEKSKKIIENSHNN